LLSLLIVPTFAASHWQRPATDSKLPVVTVSLNCGRRARETLRLNKQLTVRAKPRKPNPVDLCTIARFTSQCSHISPHHTISLHSSQPSHSLTHRRLILGVSASPSSLAASILLATFPLFGCIRLLLAWQPQRHREQSRTVGQGIELHPKAFILFRRPWLQPSSAPLQ